MQEVVEEVAEDLGREDENHHVYHLQNVDHTVGVDIDDLVEVVVNAEEGEVETYEVREEPGEPS